MFDRRFPCTFVTQPNPVFQFDMRRIRLTPERLAAFDRSALLIVHVVLLPMVWLAIGGGFLLTQSAILISLLALFGLGLAVDVYYAMLALQSVNLTSEEWDLLRMTPLRGIDIVVAKIAAVQTRVWPAMAVETALRFICGEMILIAANQHWLVVILPVVIFTGAFALESLWRMRALVVLILAIGLRTRYSATAMWLGTAFALLGFVLARFLVLVLIGAMIGGTISVARQMQNGPSPSLGLQCMYGLFLAAVPTAIATFLYSAYERVANRALLQAFHIAAQPEF